MIEGKGTIYFRNGSSYSGNFLNNEIDGNVLGILEVEDENGDYVSEECTYGFFEKKNLGKFTTLSNTFTCEYDKGELETLKQFKVSKERKSEI